MTEFIYPFFDNSTHYINREMAINNIDYPAKNNTNTDYELPLNLNVCIIREGVGFKCEWSQVKIVDQAYNMHEIFNKIIYVKTSFLTGLDNTKKSLTVHNGKKNQIDLYAPEINDSTREAFVPYLDQKNGLYCVKLEMEYEKFIDNVLFMNSLKKAHREGIRIILESRGARSDDGYIDTLINDCYTFGYVLKTPDILSIRPCVPVRFTVGVPLVFLNNLEDTTEEEPVTQNEIKYRLELNNRTIVDIASTIVFALGTRRSQIESLTYPLKFLENFIYEYEVSLVPKFVNTFNDLLNSVNRSPKSTTFQEYTIMLSEGLDILKILIYDNGAEYSVPNTVLKQFEFSKDCFTNKRLINYYLNYKSMREDALNESIGIVEFIEKYIKYPTPKLNENIEITPRISIPRENAKEYDDYFKAQQESCTNITVKDVLSNDPMYHLFVSSIHNTVPETQETLSSVINKAKDIFANVDRNAENTVDIINFKPVLDSMGVSSTLVPPDQVLTTEVDKKTGIAKNATKKIKSVQKAFIIAMNVLDRINLVKVIFEWYLCRLMQGDPNDVKTAELIKKYLTPQMIGYLINILDNDLTSKDVLFKIANNLPFDLDLFCVKNKELAYFLKAILSGNIQFGEFSIPINIQSGSFSIDFQKPFKDKINGMIKARESTRTTNNQFYRNLLGSIITNVLTELVKRLMGYLETFLTSDCPDSNLNLIPDQNILNTANPVGGFAGSSSALDTSDPTNPKNKDLANVTIPVRYDIDPDGAINLLSKLLNDLSCILTPIEVCEALEGNITAESMMLVKSLIRRKYLPDLEEMLSESNIRFLFDQLGKRVDPNVCAQIRRATSETIKNITNTLSNDPNTINALLIECDPIINKNRSKILDEKGDNPIIDQKKQKNKKNNDDISKLFDSGFNDPIDVSLFCDVEGQLQVDTSQFEDYINELLINLKYKFNEEASLVPSNFIENKTKILKQNNNISNTIEYKSPYDTFKKTILNSDFIQTSTNYEFEQQNYLKFPTASFSSSFTGSSNRGQNAVGRVNQNITKEYLLLANIISKFQKTEIFNILQSDINTDDFSNLISNIGAASIDLAQNKCFKELTNEEVHDFMLKIPIIIERRDKTSTSSLLFDDDYFNEIIFDHSNHSNYWDLEDVQALKFDQYPYLLIMSYNSTITSNAQDDIRMSLRIKNQNNFERKYDNLRYTSDEREDAHGNSFDVYNVFDSYMDQFNDLDIPMKYDLAANDSDETKERAKKEQKSLVHIALDNKTPINDSKGNEQGRYSAVNFEMTTSTEAGLGGKSYTFFKEYGEFEKFLRIRWNVWKEIRDYLVEYTSSEQMREILNLEKLKKNLEFFSKFANIPTYSANLDRGMENNKLSIKDYLYKPKIFGNGEELNINILKKRTPSQNYFERFINIQNLTEDDISSLLEISNTLSLTTVNTDYNGTGREGHGSIERPYSDATDSEIIPKIISSLNATSDKEKISLYMQDIYKSFLSDSVCSLFDINYGLVQSTNTNELVQDETTIIDFDKTSAQKESKNNYSYFVEKQNQKSLILNSINLNLLQTLQEQTCKIFPHYFNDNSWKEEFKTSLNQEMCEGSSRAFPYNTLKLITKILFRTFIAEIMTRAQHKFVYYTKTDISNIVSDTDFKTIIREAFYRELDEYSFEFMASFLYIIKILYSEMEKSEELDEKYKETIDLNNKEINYFITKEVIYYFTILNKVIDSMSDDERYAEFKNNRKYCSRYTFIQPLNLVQSLDDENLYYLAKIPNNFIFTERNEYKENGWDRSNLVIKTGIKKSEATGREMTNYALYSIDESVTSLEKYASGVDAYTSEQSYFTYLKSFGIKQANLLGLHYIMNYFNFDKNTRNNFKSIKSELTKLFIDYSKITIDNTGRNTQNNDILTTEDLINGILNNAKDIEIPPEKLRDYLDQMSKSSNPAIILHKNKHLAFQGGNKFLNNILQTSLKLTKSALEANDLASFLSKMIMQVLTTSIQLPWFLSMQEEDRKAAIANANYDIAKLLTRIELGMPLFPEGIAGLGFAVAKAYGFGPYDPFKTTMWIAADFALEALNYPEFYKQFMELRKKYRNPDKDKCETDNVTGTEVLEGLYCNRNIYSKIIDNYKFLEYHTLEYLNNPPPEPKVSSKTTLNIENLLNETSNKYGINGRYDISKRFIGDLNKNS